MSYVARFLYGKYEEKYILESFGVLVLGGNDDGWRRGEEHACVNRSYMEDHPLRYERAVETDAVLHEEETSVEFEVGNHIRIGKEIVTIEHVVKNLDGSIDYYTNKREYAALNTYSTPFDERIKYDTPKEVEDSEEDDGLIHDNWYQKLKNKLKGVN